MARWSPEGRAAARVGSLAALLLLAAACGDDPPPPGRAGAACVDSAQCGPGEACLAHLPGGTCGAYCADGCPAGTVCVALGPEDLCLAACDGPDGCREGYDCVDGACRPVSQCGDVPAEGRCEGATLTWCQAGWEVKTLDCAQFTDGTGLALTCGAPEGGQRDCIPQSVAGCGTVSPMGRCEGNTLVFCESRETGVVRREPCGNDEECRVGEDGMAQCVLPGAGGCGGVTELGACQGSVAAWCADGELRRFDCAERGERCDWVDDSVGYWCVPPPSGALRVTGTFFYEKRPVGPDGWGPVEAAPMRYVSVQVRRADGTLVASDRTDAEGRFEVPFDGEGPFFLSPLSLAAGDRFAVSVQDCPEGDCGADALLYGGYSPEFGPADADAEGVIDLGDLTVQDPAAGAFNVLDVLIGGFEFAWDTFGRRPPTLTAQWRSGSNTWCGTSCYDPRTHTIYVLSDPADRDEWDDPVLAHEFGHFLEEAFSRSDSPGGYHDGHPTDPRLAWSEGYGTWVGATLHGSPLYVDTFATGSLVVDLADTGYPRPDPEGALDQRISEFVVGEILWRLAHGSQETEALGTFPVFDAMGSWFLDEAFADRGVSGVDLVDLLDGWFCRGHGRRDVVEAVVNERMGFPYDYAGPTQCP